MSWVLCSILFNPIHEWRDSTFNILHSSNWRTLEVMYRFQRISKNMFCQWEKIVQSRNLILIIHQKQPTFNFEDPIKNNVNSCDIWTYKNNYSFPSLIRANLAKFNEIASTKSWKQRTKDSPCRHYLSVGCCN